MSEKEERIYSYSVNIVSKRNKYALFILLGIFFSLIMLILPLKLSTFLSNPRLMIAVIFFITVFSTALLINRFLMDYFAHLKLRITDMYLERYIKQSSEKMEFKNIKKILVCRDYKNQIETIVVSGGKKKLALYGFERMEEILELIKDKIGKGTTINVRKVNLFTLLLTVFISLAIISLSKVSKIVIHWGLFRSVFIMGMGVYFLFNRLLSQRYGVKIRKLEIATGLFFVIFGGILLRTSLFDLGVIRVVERDRYTLGEQISDYIVLGRKELYRNKNYDKAVEHYSKAIALEPRLWEVYYKRGYARYSKKQFCEAIEDFNKNLALNPHDANGYHMRGLSYAEIREYGKAIEDFRKAIKLGLERDYSYGNLGLALLKKGFLDEGIANVKKAIEINPEDACHYTNLGIAFKAKGEYDEAIKYHQQALERDPDNAYAYAGIGAAFYKKGDRQKAINYCNKAKGIDPNASDECYIHGIIENSYTIKKSQTIDHPRYIMYVPSGIDSRKKYPLVIAMSPSADAQLMIRVWRQIAEEYKWIIFASKESSNNLPIFSSNCDIALILNELFPWFPINPFKIIATGFSGGGMCSHELSYKYPSLISAIVVNTGMMREFRQKGEDYPRGKIAVFLASPTDFRYDEMKRDKAFLESKGWKTTWIEFEGGHRIAPYLVYRQAAQWLKEQFK